MANKIIPISKSKVVDYSNKEENNFWLKREVANISLSSDHYSIIIQSLSKVNDSVICIHSESLSDKTLIKAIFDAANNGNRIYILTNGFSEELDPLKGKCLIRIGVNNIGSYILVNPNTNDAVGYLFTGQFTETGSLIQQNLLIDLDKEQNEILYRHFCYHFWNTATKEIIDSNIIDVKTPPIDVFPCKDNFCDPQYLVKSLSNLPEKAVIATNSLSSNQYIPFGDLKGCSLVTSLSGNNNNLIKKLIKEGNEITAISQGVFISIITSESDYWIFPKSNITSNDFLYALKLNSQQRKKIDKVISSLKSNADYEFISKIKRENLQNKTVLKLDSLIGQEYKIELQVSENIGSVNQNELLPFEQFSSFEPNLPDSGKSIKVEFHWENDPFRLPDNCQEHSLYKEWENEEGKIKKNLFVIEKMIKETEDTESKLSISLKRFFLGKKNLFTGIKKEIDQLKSENFSKQSSEIYKDKIKRIGEIQSHIDNEIKLILQEDRKAKLDEKIFECKKQISARETELKGKQNTLHERQNDIDKKIDEFCKKNNFQKEEINKLKNEWIQQSGHKNKQKNPKEAFESEAKLKEFNEIQNASFVQKIESEISAINKEIKRLQDEIKRKEIDKSKDFEQSSSSSSLEEYVGGKSNSSKTSDKFDLTISSLQQLPLVGKLYQQNNQNYLTIEFWEEYDLGVKESERLTAKLCAIKN
ncbi:MAG: hypothetical protein WCH34_07495 [Bacteroidota bacterium]